MSTSRFEIDNEITAIVGHLEEMANALHAHSYKNEAEIVQSHIKKLKSIESKGARKRGAMSTDLIINCLIKDFM